MSYDGFDSIDKIVVSGVNSLAIHLRFVAVEHLKYNRVRAGKYLYNFQHLIIRDSVVDFDKNFFAKIFV